MVKPVTTSGQPNLISLGNSSQCRTHSSVLSHKMGKRSRVSHQSVLEGCSQGHRFSGSSNLPWTGTKWALDAKKGPQIKRYICWHLAVRPGRTFVVRAEGRVGRASMVSLYLGTPEPRLEAKPYVLWFLQEAEVREREIEERRKSKSVQGYISKLATPW